ncbi:MAG: NADP-dependent phosphogluconate dehydrogenase [Candidatus Makana argininalis]
MIKNDIGIIGMSIMGKNLAINIENKGYRVSVFNRSKEKTEILIYKHPFKKIYPFYNINDFINSIKLPRIIFLIIKPGKPIDLTINLLKNIINKNDIIIDCGNSLYKDTLRRNKILYKEGFKFIGVGISGGEEGALNGLSIMAGGNKSTYRIVEPIFKKIAANVKGYPCVTYVGKGGSGHYVKMIHNGIEYSYMQLISEVYYIMKNALGLNNDDLYEIFNTWDNGELKSYLINITKKILIKKNYEGKFILDLIIDEALNKKTGKWSINSSIEIEEPFNVATEALFFRYISSMKNQRIIASKILNGPINKKYNHNYDKFIEKIRQSLYLSKIISYAQGFSHLKKGSNKNNWHLNYYEIAKIFRNGCIIRSKILEKIMDVYDYNPNIYNILLSSYFTNIANKYNFSLRYIVSYAIKNGYPVPALSSSVSYYDSYRSKFLSSNLIQAQRDYFGSHNYKRIDKNGIFHTNWDN